MTLGIFFEYGLKKENPLYYQAVKKQTRLGGRDGQLGNVLKGT